MKISVLIDEFRDAFYAVAKGVKYAGATTETIELHRPFAQVNVATSDLAEVLRQGERPQKTTLTVTGVSNAFDLFNATATVPAEEITASFTEAYIPGLDDSNKDTYTVGDVDDLATGGKDYDYLSMAYVLVPGGKDDTSVSTLTATVTYSSDVTATISYEGATLQQNRRTNLIGQLLTTSADYEIIVDEDFLQPGYDYEYENVRTVEEANLAFASGRTSVKIEEITEESEIVLPSTTEETTVLLPETTETITFTYAKDATEEEKPDVLNITAPEGTNIVLKVENTTVYINGVFQDVTSATAEHTLVVTEGTTITNLYVKQGNVRIETGGVVKNISRADNNGDNSTTVHLGEGITASIDEEGKTTVDFGNGDILENSDPKIEFIPFATPETGLSLVDQVSAINYGKITLTEDVTLTETLTIGKGKEIILDLNGKTISGTATEASASNLIAVKGGANLTIKNGTITFAATTPDTELGGEGQPEYPGYANNTIRNEGILTIENATLENKTKKGGASYVIDNYVGSKLTVNNGSVITQSGGDVAIRMFSSDEGSIDVTVNGGTITGYRAIWIQLAGSNKAVSPAMNVIVNGGELNSSDSNYNDAVYSYSYGNDMKDVNIDIYGGTFNGNVALTGGSNKTNIETVTVYGGTIQNLFSYGTDATKTAEAITITGGTFANDPSELVEEGYVAVLDNGLYVVTRLDEMTLAVKYDSTISNEENGTKLYNAFKNAKDGATIYLTNGTYYLTDNSTNRFLDKNITISGLDETIIEVNKKGVVFQASTPKTMNLKNLKIKSGTQAIYAKDWGTLNLNNVICETEGTLAILLDSANGINNKFINDVTTTVNATDVIIDEGDTVEFCALPCTSLPQVTDVVTKCCFNFEGSNITTDICKPQSIARSTGNNMFVNGVALPAYSE